MPVTGHARMRYRPAGRRETEELKMRFSPLLILAALIAALYFSSTTHLGCLTDMQCDAGDRAEQTRLCAIDDAHCD